MKSFFIDTKKPATLKDLEEAGVIYEYITPDTETYMTPLKAWMQKRGYASYDEVRLSEKTPNLDALLGKFIDEHLHTDDEVRYVVSGSGIFDVRSKEDQWIRIVVTAGDFIIVPADLYHRFMLGEEKMIHAVRLFKDNPSWVPVYRL